MLNLDNGMGNSLEDKNKKSISKKYRSMTARDSRPNENFGIKNHDVN